MSGVRQQPGRGPAARKEFPLNKKTRIRKIPRSLIYVYVLIILFTLLTVATYTWFTISRTPKVSDLGLSVNAPSGLELSADPLAPEWTQHLDFAELTGETAPLRPVTWSEKDQRFYAATYGFDGRMTGRWEPLTDSRNANKNNTDGYYLMGTFYARCDQKATVSLSSAIEVEEGKKGAGTFLVGTPLWDSAQVLHNNGGSGAEMAVRIGLKLQKTDLEGNATAEDSVFYIYEPNANTHLDGDENYVETPSIDGSANLVPEDRLITQNACTWTETNPVERSVVIYDMGEFTSDTELFRITKEELVKITVYVWLEGQDVDCTNMVGQAAQVLANLQFSAAFDSGSGLEPVK